MNRRSLFRAALGALALRYAPLAEAVASLAPAPTSVYASFADRCWAYGWVYDPTLGGWTTPLRKENP